MESKHTAGAWEAIFDNDERGQPQVIYRGLICFLKHAPDGRISVVTDGRSCAPEEWEANAHLISAAPDLLEALRVAVLWCPFCHGTGRHAPIVAWPAMPEAEERRALAELPESVECSQCKAARAAILKATGGAP